MWIVAKIKNIIINQIAKLRSLMRLVEFKVKIMHFKELRSGQDLAYTIRKAINIHDWSGDSAKYLNEYHV